MRTTSSSRARPDPASRLAPDGAERVLPGKGAFQAPGGSIVDMLTPGSGGFGDPAERDPAALEADLTDGYVTPKGAARDYGAG